MNALILTVSAGGGHTKAAESLKEYIEQRNPSSNTQIVDMLKYASPVIDKLVIGGYLKTVKTTPALYGKLYDLSETKSNLSHLSYPVGKMLSSKTQELINSHNPSIIVCTHPFALQLLQAVEKKHLPNCPIVAVITDFAIHDFWVFDGVDAYVVANQALKNDLVDRGIPEDTIYPFGIPISKSFLEHRDKTQILKNYGLKEDLLTILVAGGSLGYGEIKDVIKHLSLSKIPLQIMVLAGKNNKLKADLEKQSELVPKNIKVFGFIDRVSDLMDASDLIITKPGGLTISEALVKQLPIFLMSPIPGQERRNAEFLLNFGAAISVSKPENIENCLRIILDNPLRKQAMIDASKMIAKPYSSRDAVILFETLIGYQPKQSSSSSHASSNQLQ